MISAAGQITSISAASSIGSLSIAFVKCNGQKRDPFGLMSMCGLYQTQLTLFGNPLVCFAWIFDPIFKLPVVALRKSRAYLICAAGSVLAARGRSITHTLADVKFVTCHGSPHVWSLAAAALLTQTGAR